MRSKASLLTRLIIVGISLIPSSQGRPSGHSVADVVKHEQQYRNRTLEIRAGDGLASGKQRWMWIMLSTVSRSAIQVPDIGSAYPVHASLFLSETKDDEAMTVDVGTMDGTREGIALIGRYGEPLQRYRDNVFAWPFPSPSTPSSPSTANRAFRLHSQQLPQQTRLTNRQLLDWRTGWGLASQVWARDASVDQGHGRTSPYKGPLTFVETLISHPALLGPDWRAMDRDMARMGEIFDLGKAYWQHGPWRITKQAKAIQTKLKNANYEFALLYQNRQPVWVRSEPAGTGRPPRPSSVEREYPAAAVDRDPDAVDLTTPLSADWEGSDWEGEEEDVP